MKSAVETLNATRVKLTVEVPFDELEPSMASAYKTIGQQVQVPGFRKGKVPPRIIDQRIGRAAVLQEAVNDALPGFYAQAAQENEVRPLGQPEVEVTEVPDPGQGGDLKFTVEVDVRPELDLPDFSTLEVGVDDVDVTDADVDARVDQLRERFGALVGVDRPVADGDFVSIDVAATIGDEDIDSATGISYQVGSKNMLDGLDEALVGVSAGETATFTAPLAGGDHAGDDAEVTVTVQSVKERELPDVDDDFAQMASEFDTVDELRADLRGQATQTKRFEQGVQARDRLLDLLLERVEVPVPDSLVETEVHRHLEAEERLEDDEHRTEVAEEARKALRTQLLLDAIVEREEVQVGQEELIEYLVAQAPQYGMDPNAFAQAIQEAGQIQAMVAEVGRRKALAVVLENATVTDASGTVVDLDDVVPGRRAAEAAAAAEQGVEDGTDEEPLDEEPSDEQPGDEQEPGADDPASVRL